MSKRKRQHLSRRRSTTESVEHQYCDQCGEYPCWCDGDWAPAMDAYRDEPPRCPCCHEYMYDQKDKDQGIHEDCLGTGPAYGLWVLCTICKKPFFCDNGCFDDCGEGHGKE